jgi:predicted nucleic acid-binding protein
MLLLDTWAWVAYFRGTPAGRRVAVALDEPVATSIVTIAELSDLQHRGRGRGLEEQVAFIASRGPLLDVDLPILVEAGRTKWAQRRRRVPMGLFDAIVYETARANGHAVLTGDDGFRGLPAVEFLGEKPGAG